jgi:plastocyanin
MKLLLALSIVMLLAGCTGSTVTDTTSASPGGATSRKVDLYDNRFEDGNLTLTKGATITYRNEGEHGHTVTVHWVGEPVTTLRLDKTLQPGETVDFTFKDAGTYHVWCRFHGMMTSGMATVVKVT